MSDHSITSLIEKLEGAEVGSGHLDADLMEAFGYSTIRGRLHPRGPNWRYRGSGQLGFESHWGKTPKYTTSLDAALALAERVLGGKKALLLLTDLLTREADASDFDLITVSDLPRLLCAAVLRAQSEARV